MDNSNTQKSISKGFLPLPGRKKLLLEVVDRLKTKHYSQQTIDSYVRWIKTYIIFHKKQHLSKLKELEIEEFLTHLAMDLRLSGASQNQALNALIFLYRDCLGIKLENINSIRAKTPKLTATVLTFNEIRELRRNIDPRFKLVFDLTYGCGLRIQAVSGN